MIHIINFILLPDIFNPPLKAGKDIYEGFKRFAICAAKTDHYAKFDVLGLDTVLWKDFQIKYVPVSPISMHRNIYHCQVPHSP